MNRIDWTKEYIFVRNSWCKIRFFLGFCLFVLHMTTALAYHLVQGKRMANFSAPDKRCKTQSAQLLPHTYLGDLASCSNGSVYIYSLGNSVRSRGKRRLNECSARSKGSSSSKRNSKCGSANKSLRYHLRNNSSKLWQVQCYSDLIHALEGKICGGCSKPLR